MTKNILLLALSTFPGPKDAELITLNKNAYIYENEDGSIDEVTGVYQLDPVPKLLACKKGILFDHIVMLATEATETKVQIEIKGESSPQMVSPLAFFEDSMLKCQVSRNMDRNSLFKEISLNESLLSSAIADTVDYLREVSQKDDIHLYVDTHGGFRGTQLVLEAILSLVAKDRISETHIYSMKFGDKTKPNRIVKDETMRMFDFVSGINEFLNYGRIDSLVRYLKAGDNKTLVDAIQKISEGIQWCHLDNFETGLNQLRTYYETTKTDGDPYLKMFEDRIRKDYGLLLESAKPDPIYVIKWCMAKGFYQQALTIIESRMIDSFTDRGLIQITDTAKEFQKHKENCPYSSEKEVSNTDILNGCISNYMAQTDWWNADGYHFNDVFEENKADSDDIEQQMKTLYGIIEAIFDLNTQKAKWQKPDKSQDWDKILNTATTCSIKPAGKTKNAECENAIAFGSDVILTTEEDKKWFAFVLFMHKTLKTIRNKSNHALEHNPYDPEAVKQAILFYLWLIDEKAIV